VYASAPVSKVIGYFELAAVLAGPPDNLWRRTKHAAGIKRSYFQRYFSGCRVGYALKVKNPTLYDWPKDLQESFSITRAPQSFCYVPSPPLQPEL
jgi:predicted transcriptional regulator